MPASKACELERLAVDLWLPLHHVHDGERLVLADAARGRQLDDISRRADVVVVMSLVVRAALQDLPVLCVEVEALHLDDSRAVHERRYHLADHLAWHGDVTRAPVAPSRDPAHVLRRVTRASELCSTAQHRNTADRRHFVSWVTDGGASCGGG